MGSSTKTLVELKDKLKTLKANNGSNVEIAKTLNLMVRAEYRHDPSNALLHANEVLILVNKINDQPVTADTYNVCGIVFMAQGEYARALNNFKQSLDISLKIDDKLRVSTVYNNMGNVYRLQGNLKEAFNLYVKALTIKEKSNDQKGLINSNINIGNILRLQKQYKNAMERYLQALSISKTLDMKKNIASSLNNIGLLLSDQNDLVPAREQHEKALTIRKEIGDTAGIANSYGNIGTILEKQEKYQEALEYYLKTLHLKEEVIDRKGIALTCSNIASIYINLKELGEAKSFLNRSLEMSREIGARDMESTSLKHLSKLYEARKDFKLALEFMKEHIEIQEVVFNEETRKEIASLQVRYETEKQQRETEIYFLKNIELQKEVTDGKKLELELRKQGDLLEKLIRERTAELLKTNREMKIEISEREKAEKARIKAEAGLQSFLNHLEDMIYFFSEKGKIVDINEAYIKLTGYSSSDFENDPSLWKRIIHSDDWKNSRSFLSKHPEGISLYEHDYRLKTKSGSLKWLHSKMVGVWSEEGNFKGYSCIDRDITARKTAEQKLRQSYIELEKSFKGTVFTISKIIEARDPYTCGHQLRTAELAHAIATEMQLSEEQVQAIYLATVVHDIGKINIPQEYLTKPGKLSEVEWSVLKTHPQIGYDILSTIDFPWPIAEIVQQHHELLNGSGYPQALKEDEILIEAKIVCVADVVEAMGSHRPYRPTLGLEKTLKHILQYRGVLYDTAVVDACLKVIDENKFDISSLPQKPDDTLNSTLN